jgi:hypothetical protein
MNRLSKESGGFSMLIATLMTIVVLLAIGGVMYLMVTEVTPGGTPAIGALTSTKASTGNYTVRVIALTNNVIDRHQVSVIVHPDNASIFVGEISGSGDFLSQGDTFSIGELQPGLTYSIIVRYEPTGATIASLSILA